MMKSLRVRIIGVNAQSGWSRDSHVPALRNLNGVELVAVAASSKATADAAAHAYGVPAAYGSGLDLIKASDIDLVTVATRVPDHHELVLAAIHAGKHVYCEWPLGRDVKQVDEMTAAARSAGVCAVIGLQLRANRSVQKALELILSGDIGRVLGVKIYSATAGFGPNLPSGSAYLEEPENFANLITIQAAHTIDLAIAVAGGLVDLNGLATRRCLQIRIGNGSPRPRTTFDHLLLQGRLESGGTLSVEVEGGRPPGTPFRLEVQGEDGSIRLDGGAARGVQTGRLALSLNGSSRSVDEGELSEMTDSSVNVAGLYASLRDDIANGSSNVSDFDHAAKLTRLVVDVLKSAETGMRRIADRWPIK